MRRFLHRIGLSHDRAGSSEHDDEATSNGMLKSVRKRSTSKSSFLDKSTSGQDVVLASTHLLSATSSNDRLKEHVNRGNVPTQPLSTAPLQDESQRRRVQSLAARHNNVHTQADISPLATPPRKRLGTLPPKDQNTKYETLPAATKARHGLSTRTLSPTVASRDQREIIASDVRQVNDERRSTRADKVPIFPKSETNHTIDAMLPAVLEAAQISSDMPYVESSQALSASRGRATTVEKNNDDVDGRNQRVTDANAVVPSKSVVFAPAPKRKKTSPPFAAREKEPKAFPTAEKTAARPSSMALDESPQLDKRGSRDHARNQPSESTMSSATSPKTPAFGLQRPMSAGSKIPLLADKVVRSSSGDGSTLSVVMHGMTKSSLDLSPSTRTEVPFGGTLGLLHQSRDHSLQNSVPFAMDRESNPSVAGNDPPRLTVGELNPQKTVRTSLPVRFGSSSSLSQGWSSVGARSFGGPSWSDMTQEDLVANIGGRERTRQEVLWEIVASEERYVQELQRAKELYIDPLLCSNAGKTEQPKSPRSDALATLEGQRPTPTRGNEVLSPYRLSNNPAEQRKSLEASGNLPIANQFLHSPKLQGSGADTDSPNSSLSVLRELSPSHQNRRSTKEPSVQACTPRQAGPTQGGLNEKQKEKLDASVPKSKEVRTTMSSAFGFRSPDIDKKQRRKQSPLSSSRMEQDLPIDKASLPAPLRTVLETLNSGIIEGHHKLSAALKQRYEEQWPLVRSLADVFTRFAFVLKLYREYVVHLERALNALDEFALMERAMRGKRLRKDRTSPSILLGRRVAQLEVSAASQGECGIGIFLSMPFQRLLKYPLLFQNLLFHTDASTYEFENTVRMVIDVEHIVRAIEDEKVSKEERDKTIDAFARIENIKDRLLLRPKKDRLLIEELALYDTVTRRAHSDSDQMQDEQVPATAMSTPIGGIFPHDRPPAQGRRSNRRLSELLSSKHHDKYDPQKDTTSSKSTTSKIPSLGSKRDLWLIRFSDVEIRCQRVGLTALPIVSSAPLANATEGRQSFDDRIHHGALDDVTRIKEDFQRTRESRERQKALRNYTLRSNTRNLYKFVSVARWKVTNDKPSSTSNLQMDEVVEEEEGEEHGERERVQEHEEHSMDESSSTEDSEDGMLDTEPYIRQNKLSFSYGGNDRVEPRLLSSEHRLSTNSTRSLISAPDASMYSLGKPSSSSHLPSVREDLKPLLTEKRHSLNARSSPIPTTQSPSTSVEQSPLVRSKLSRVVAANSKARSDKFGNRLRRDTPTRYRADPSSNMRSPASPRNYDEPQQAEAPTLHISVADGQLSEQPVYRPDFDVAGHASTGKLKLQSPLDGTRGSTRFPSFLRERSIDSNLRLMSSLIQSASPRVDEEKDSALIP